ncbi:hypothetical protein PISL3812_09951 [Talaromyces islandicus]|uniref:Uncharacterized protein n=1 Tax=Talaromyces islandicus TaxID=28573 RepID=A0A0U1MD48_TALIS|nr:hypothetical protein PISL3812_09951 [Talaromyces islandicus]
MDLAPFNQTPLPDLCDSCSHNFDQGKKWSERAESLLKSLSEWNENYESAVNQFDIQKSMDEISGDEEENRTRCVWCENTSFCAQFLRGRVCPLLLETIKNWRTVMNSKTVTVEEVQEWEKKPGLIADGELPTICLENYDGHKSKLVCDDSSASANHAVRVAYDEMKHLAR